MPPRIAIVVRGGVVQEVASDIADVLINLLDMDSIEDPERFEAYTSGGQTP